MITPNDIETKVFSSSLKGYNRREVDEFLDQIMIDYQALLDQNSKMKERISDLQRRTPVQATSQGETEVTLEEAKKLMNDISASAEQRAEMIIHNAEQDAANIVNDAKDSTTRADEEVEQLRQKIEKFKVRYKNLLEEELERVDDKSEVLLNDLKEDFYPESIFGEEGTSPLTRATGIGVAKGTTVEVIPEGGKPAKTEEKPEPKEAEHEELDLGEFAPESEQKDSKDPEPEAEPEETAVAEPEEAAGDEPEKAADDEEPEKEPDDQEAEAEETEDAPEEKAQEVNDEPKEEEKDPLLERAKEANVDVNDLPGFRSSNRDKTDDTMIFNMNDENTMDLDLDPKEAEALKRDNAENSAKSIKEKAESHVQTAAERAKEFKETATKLASELFSKKGSDD